MRFIHKKVLFLIIFAHCCCLANSFFPPQKQNSVCMCASVRYINMNQFSCLLLLLIWLLVEFGLLPCPQPLLLMQGLLL